MPRSERTARISEGFARSADKYESIVFSADPVTKAPFLVGATYSADAFPLLPGQPSIFSYFGDFNGIPLTDYTIFPRSKGYVVSEDLVGALAETTYRNRRYAEISRKIESNPENWTLQKFRSKTEQIDSVTYPDREITQYVAESDLMLSVDPSVTGPTLPVTGRIDVLAPLETGVKEVRFYHFIPSFVATFVLYYVINALIVSGFRDFKQDIEHWSLRKDFFINNVIGSALISVGVVSLWIYATFPPNTSLVSEVSQLLGSAVLWTGVFATVVNELRKLTRYAWIISGLSMSAILASVVGPTRFESFVFATFVSGATVAYPLILGVISEYGRIHGEHFLERSIREKEDKDVEK
nr:MAG: hypothetical protein J07AB56_03980 [Candidatus Nanosalinarum sp. J07AB56]